VEPLRLQLPAAHDGVVAMDRLGRVALGDLGRLDVWWLGGYGGGVFLPLRDGSAGTTTYGGGRHLLDTIKGADLAARPADWWSTWTSPTTRPAPKTRAGRARWPRRATGSTRS
jgi:hypothetical protein